jgi:hypothetical protein
MGPKPGLPGVVIVGHRTLRQVLALVRVYDDATSESKRHHEHKGQPATTEHGCAT